jgi:hypothetical protein
VRRVQPNALTLPNSPVAKPSRRIATRRSGAATCASFVGWATLSRGTSSASPRSKPKSSGAQRINPIVVIFFGGSVLSSRGIVKRLSIVAALALFLIGTACDPAFARGGRGGGRGAGFQGHSHGAHFHGSHFHRSARVGFFVGGSAFGSRHYPSAWYYPPPYYYPAPYYFVDSPYWYYCHNPAGYYPDIPTVPAAGKHSRVSYFHNARDGGGMGASGVMPAPKSSDTRRTKLPRDDVVLEV